MPKVTGVKSQHIADHTTGEMVSALRPGVFDSDSRPDSGPGVFRLLRLFSERGAAARNPGS
jgi:hypothetical protein